MKSLLFLVFFVTLNIINAEFEFDNCVRDFDSKPGVCRNARDCPSFRSDQRNDILTTCSYINRQSIVCCVDVGNNQQQQQPQQQQQQQPKPEFVQQTSQQSGGRLSEQYCTEYGKGLTTNHFIGSLSIGGSEDVVSISKCEYVNSLVVGGEVTKQGEFPHMAAIGYLNSVEKTIEFLCGGSLISDRFVLTAAHCSGNSRSKVTVVRLGDQNLKTKNDAKEIDIPVRRVIKHENYRAKTSYNDIALIELAEIVTFSKDIRPACLYQNPQPNERTVVATGWGATAVYGPTSDELMKVRLDIVNNNDCAMYFEYDDAFTEGIKDSQMCAGDFNSTKDTCQGDSGGPIQLRSKTNQCLYYVVGLTSRGSFCGTRTPSVYTRVSYYLDWIEQKVWNNSP